MTRENTSDRRDLPQPDQFWQLLVEHSQIGMVLVDAGGHILTLNKQAIELLKYGSIDYLGRVISDFLPVSGPRIMEGLKRNQPLTGFHGRGNGPADSIVLNFTPISHNGEVIAGVCEIQAETKVDQAARQLVSYQNLNEQLEAIIESSVDGIFVCGGDGRILHMNRASEELSGAKATDLLGKDINVLVRRGIIDHSASLEALSSGKRVHKVVHLQKTGKHILVSANPVFDEEGKISLVVLNERDITKLSQTKEELERTRQASRRYRDELRGVSLLELSKHSIVAESRAMRQVLTRARKLSSLGVSNILICGESGTGKGLISKFIHQSSERAEQPFIHLNCAALPPNLIEAELFGYEKGAFTGADETGKMGLVELADGGTLFLDEIGDMPLNVQAKMLKFLDDQLVVRLGATNETEVDCRIIAATNLDLAKCVDKGAFRRDLFYRLNGFSLDLPPLRERPEDIFGLANHYLETFNKMFRQNRRLSHRAIDVLQAHDFSGNVRELINLMKKAVALSERSDLFHILKAELAENQPGFSSREQSENHLASLPAQLDALEKNILQKAKKRGLTTREMAQELSISQPTVVRKLKKHGLDF